MRYAVMLGWGIVIYAVMFLLWTSLVTYELSTGPLSAIIRIVGLIAVTAIAGRALRMHSWADILPYSIGWAIMVGTFDALLVVPFSGWQIYSDWNVLFGYALVVIVPLFSSLQMNEILARPFTQNR